MRRLLFRPRAVVTLLTILFVVLTAALGSWQLERARSKDVRERALEQRRDAPPMALERALQDPEDNEWRRVHVEGEFLAERTVLIDNQVLSGRAGYHVVTPLRVAGTSRYVLVNRGWVETGSSRDELPKISTPRGAARLEGIAVLPSRRVFELGTTPAAARVWPNLSAERIAAMEFAVERMVLLQTSETEDGLLRRWGERRGSDATKNRGYALQWFSFGLLAVILYVALNLRLAPAAGHDDNARPTR